MVTGHGSRGIKKSSQAKSGQRSLDPRLEHHWQNFQSGTTTIANLASILAFEACSYRCRCSLFEFTLPAADQTFESRET
jgi:hypothetical protein